LSGKFIASGADKQIELSVLISLAKKGIATFMQIYGKIYGNSKISCYFRHLKQNDYAN
jgi:hypothetical protein